MTDQTRYNASNLAVNVAMQEAALHNHPDEARILREAEAHRMANLPLWQRIVNSLRGGHRKTVSGR